MLALDADHAELCQGEHDQDATPAAVALVHRRGASPLSHIHPDALP
jgi:hypothetical protein